MVTQHRHHDDDVSVKLVQSHDALDHGQCLQGWRLECVQLSSGPFQSTIRDVRLDHCQIIRERANQAMMKRGASWGDSIVLSLPLTASGRGWATGRELPEGTILLSDGDDLPEIHTPKELDLICLAFGRRWFAIKAMEAGYRRLSGRVWRQDGFFLPEAHRQALVQLLTSIVSEVDLRPSILDHATSRLFLEEEILRHLLAALDSSVLVSSPGDTPRKQTADYVRDLALRDASEAPNLAAICQQLGISRAHLQNCFRLSYGLTATQMLRAIRLHAVRRDLREANRNGKTTSIGDVAARWGFWHWSRFTGDYRNHFGELPSTTLRAGKDAIPDRNLQKP